MPVAARRISIPVVNMTYQKDSSTTGSDNLESLNFHSASAVLPEFGSPDSPTLSTDDSDSPNLGSSVQDSSVRDAFILLSLPPLGSLPSLPPLPTLSLQLPHAQEPPSTILDSSSSLPSPPPSSSISSTNSLVQGPLSSSLVHVNVSTSSPLASSTSSQSKDISNSITSPIATTLATTTVNTPTPDDFTSLRTATTDLSVSSTNSASEPGSSGGRNNRNPNLVVILIIGVVIGVLGFIILGVVYCFFRRWRRQRIRSNCGLRHTNELRLNPESSESGELTGSERRFVQTSGVTTDNGTIPESESRPCNVDARESGFIHNLLLMPQRNRHAIHAGPVAVTSNSRSSSVGNSQSTPTPAIITPFHLPSRNDLQPVSNLKVEETDSSAPASLHDAVHESNPESRRISLQSTNCDHIHFIGHGVQSDTQSIISNSGLHQPDEPSNLIRLLPAPSRVVRVPHLSILTDSAAEPAPLVPALLTETPNLDSTTSQVMLPTNTDLDSGLRWHAADSGVRLGGGILLLYDDNSGTNFESSLQSKDRFPPVYTRS